jgi:hypothetical protein
MKVDTDYSSFFNWARRHNDSQYIVYNINMYTRNNVINIFFSFAALDVSRRDRTRRINSFTPHSSYFSENTSVHRSCILSIHSRVAELKKKIKQKILVDEIKY